MGNRSCIKCGTPLITDSEENLCPRCLNKKLYYSENYYDTNDMSPLLGVGQRQVRKNYENGTIPIERVPGIRRILLPKTKFDQWLKDGKPPAAKTTLSAIQEQAYAMCRRGDHSWMQNHLEYYGNSYVSESNNWAIDNRMVSVGIIDICNFCGHREYLFPKPAARII
jgi:excisionase family DNA binding protein